MKKLLTCFFAITMFAPSVYAADGAVSRVIPTGDVSKTTASRTLENNSVDMPKSSSRTAVSRVANRDFNIDKGTSENSVRNTVSRVFSGASDKEVAIGKKTISRGGVVARQGASEKSSGRGLDAAVNTVGRNERVSSASINSNPSVRRAGLVLRPSTAEVGGRATIGDTGIQTGSNIDEQLRSVKSRASNVQATAESIAEATERLESTATLNKSCQEQYNECMDQFCAIVDTNQKRCSCSANIAKYAKVEEAVKDANVQLNDVAQRIRYVGLSADEIRAIMTETEAEEVLSGTKDTSETRDMLSQIEDLIRDPKSSASYSSGDTGFGLDIDLDFSSDSADMFSLDFLSGNNTGNLSNMRGTELYNAAKKRCNTVLNQCKQAGATINQITGNYDLAIDKDCVAYEQGLTKMNETLVGNVRSANLMLQKARLAVLQNKNQYDAKGCIGALEACMTDDMVCGDKYYKCVDPTKRYIDEKGQVVLGQNISHITSFMKNYNNAAINTEFLTNAYNKTISVDNCKYVDDKTGGTGDCVVKYLLTKIGTKQKVTDEGLCRAVLDKCQNYTYDSNGTYKPYNDVVTNYIQRALVNIRAAQYNIISEYASTCMVDVANCYNQQVTQVNSWSSSASLNSIHNVMKGACRNVALTCAYAVFNDHGDTSLCPSGDTETCITSISEMFYNSLLCEDGEVYNHKQGKCMNTSKAEKITFKFNNFASGIKDESQFMYAFYDEVEESGGTTKRVYKELILPGAADIMGINTPWYGSAGKVSWCYYSVADGENKCFIIKDASVDKTAVMKPEEVEDFIENSSTYLKNTLSLSYMNKMENCIGSAMDLIWDGNGCYCAAPKADNKEGCGETTDSCPSDYFTCTNESGAKTCVKKLGMYKENFEGGLYTSYGCR
ncbi:MAG: hypothetical protein R8M71_02745 [Alphaproteobacteria bacterium]|nr:hypothetical protein [Alphaproteobacteria bacterium]